MSTQMRVGDSIRMGARLGADLLETIASSSVARGLTLRMPGQCCCEIPPPCWMPKSLGTLGSRVCRGGTALVRLGVTNCSPTDRTILLEASGADGGDVEFEPSKLSLGPMERAEVTARLPLPATGNEKREALIWAHGCHSHYLRWTVGSGGRSDSCHEIDVKDCPDYIHHWYDHFYCDHPCPTRQKR
jgi:hypothetical protein